MGGGLLQLVLSGQQDQYITQNPQMSFFKYVYKRHTNYSMESIPLYFETNPQLIPKGDFADYKCYIKRYGDLLSNLYFSFTLPNIYSSDKYKFRWIENIGNIFIKKVTITVNDIVIDSIVGEWLSIWNELSLKDNGSYNRLIGQTAELISPTIADTRVGVKNNKFYYIFYPASSYVNGDPPSIKSKRLYVPLNFWFTRNPSLALPLLKLQLSEICINMQVRSSENLYQVWSDILDAYISPEYYNELHKDEVININTFAPIITLNPYIEANYIFLENEERNSLIKMSNFVNENKQSGMRYMIENVYVSTEKELESKSSAKNDIYIDMHKHAKEIIWTMRRSDYYKYNIYNNYTASPTYNEYSKILTGASIIWNRTNTRIEKDADYFSYLQPYQHHTNVPRVGIYCYSFALIPEKIHPTGSYNGSVVTSTLRLEIDGSYRNNNINEKLRLNSKAEYEFNYLVNIYTITLNVFEVIGGKCFLKFS